MRGRPGGVGRAKGGEGELGRTVGCFWSAGTGSLGDRLDGWRGGDFPEAVVQPVCCRNVPASVLAFAASNRQIVVPPAFTAVPDAAAHWHSALTGAASAANNAAARPMAAGDGNIFGIWHSRST